MRPLRLTRLLFLLWLLQGTGAAVLSAQPGGDTVRVGVLRHWPPHYLTTPQGEPTGFAVDVMEAVADRTGLALRYVPYETFPEVIEGLRRGEVEVIPDMGIVAERAADFVFTRPFDAFRLSLFTRASDDAVQTVADLVGRRVGVVRSNAAVELLRERHPELELAIYESVDQALFELLAAGVDAVAYPEEVFLGLARSVAVEGRLRALPEPLREVVRGMAVVRTDTALAARLDEGVESLVGTREYAAIYQRWFNPPEPFWNVRRVVEGAAGLLLLLALVMGWWRYRSVARLAGRLQRSLEERDELEEARTREERRFQTLVETAYEGIVLSSSDDRVVFVNDRVPELVDASREEILGASLLTYVAEEHHHRIRDGMARRRQGLPGSYEVLLRGPSGKEVWVQVSVAPLLGDQGDYQGSVATLTDITDRIRTKRELEETTRLLRRTLDSLGDAVFVLDPVERTIVECNPAAEGIFGYRREELLGMESRLLHLDDEAHRRFAREATQVLQEGRTFHGEVEMRRADGSVVPTSHVVSVLDPARGLDGGVVSVVRDLTERRAAEEELRERERRFRAFIEYAPGLISTLDAEGRMDYQSLALERLLGYTQEELKGESVFAYVHPDDRDELDGIWSDLVAEPGVTVHTPRFRFRHKDGSWRIWEVTITNLLDDPAVEALLANGTDMTQQVELERQLRQSQKLEAVGRLAGGVAHDFNNLLTVIQANAQLLATGEVEPDALGEYVQEVGEAAARGADLTRQLLAFSRDQILRPRPTDLNGALADIERLLRRVIGEDVALETELDPDLNAVEVDPSQLDQIIMNLAVNARDAMPRGGTLRIVTRPHEVNEEERARLDLDETGAHVCLEIRDTGRGMDPETRERIFEPFFTTKPMESGTGLGLATVYGVVRQSGGGIEVESAPGEGTVFRLYFPALPGDAIATDPSGAGAAVPERHGGGAILVVEDDPAVRRVTRKILERCGYSVEVAGSVSEAREILAGHDSCLALLLTDVVLPDGSGIDLMDHVREHYPDMALVVMSGYSRREAVEERILKMDTPYLPKPFTPEGLASAVRSALGGTDEA